MTVSPRWSSAKKEKMSKTLEIKVNTSRRQEFIDITENVRKIVRQSGIESGIALVFVPHTTAGITINEHADPSVKADIQNRLSELVPDDAHYQHLEGNADAHIKSVIVGSSISIIVENGEPLLGTWQGIFLAEFDGPRTRKILVKIVGEK